MAFKLTCIVYVLLQVWALVVMARQMLQGRRARRDILEAYRREGFNWDISDDPWIQIKAAFKPSSIFLATDSTQVREAKNAYLIARGDVAKGFRKACAVQIAAFFALLLAVAFESLRHKP